MYNRYDGNTGRFVRIPEPEPPGAQAAARPAEPASAAGAQTYI